MTTRAIDLEGGFNVRDLGGYKNREGRTVKWRKLLRSGHLAHLTPTDLNTLETIGLNRIHDFRDEKEQARMRSQPVRAESINDYHILSGSLSLYRKLIKAGELDEHTSHQSFIGIYKSCVQEVITPFTRLFTHLIANADQTSLFHCSAGKDRTGMAAALILSALDVPRDIIIEDYLLTAQHMDADSILDMIEEFLGFKETKVERDWLVPIVSVHEDFIGSFFSVIEDEYGDVDNYLKNALKLTDSDREKMKDVFLEG